MRLVLGLKTKIILPLALIMMIGTGFLLTYNYFIQINILKQEEKRGIESALRTANILIENSTYRYLAMSSILSRLSIVQEALYRKDRNTLIDKFLPIFNYLKTNFRLTQMQFHLPPATSFLRLHDINLFGDDLSSFRQTIVQTYQTKKPTVGIEVGVAGVGLRAVEPIFYRNEYIGSIEIAGGVQPDVEVIKQAILSDVGIIIHKDHLSQWIGLKNIKVTIGDWIPIATTLQDIKVFINENTLKKADQSKEKYYIDDISVGGKDYSIVYAPLLDFSGKKIGFLYIVRDKVLSIEKSIEILSTNFIIYVVILVIMIFIIINIMNKFIINPIINLSNIADNISMGNTSQKIEIKGLSGEIAILAKAIERMRITMKKLLE